MENDELNLNDFFALLWFKKNLIAITTIFFAVFSIFYAIYLPNFYTSSALLAPQQSSESISPRMIALSPVANAVGLNSPVNNDATKAIARMGSYDFFINYFLPNIRIEHLAAVKKWTAEDNKIHYNTNIFNNGEWVSRSKIPSNQELYKIYKRIFSVSQSKQTQFITIKIQHKSPHIAKEWLDTIIKYINSSMMEEEILVAQDSINFLNNSIQETNVAELKDAISILLGSQMQKLMLASSNSSVVLMQIDPPIAPEYKSSPARALICMLGTFLGFFSSIIYVIARQIYSPEIIR